MMNQDFTEISKRYKETSIIQNSAAEILFALLDVKENESVLDVGCGTGNLTDKLFEKSKGYIVGIDQSTGMIDECRKSYKRKIDFQVGSAEEMSYENLFDLIFCNSTFQWVKEADKAVSNFYNALKKEGRIGIQAPGGKEYCPNFIQAVESVKNHEKLGVVFNKFKAPWLFLDTAGEYADLFQNQGFKVPFCEIQRIESLYTPEEVYKIFASGAIAGYLNQAYYSCEIDDEYMNGFKSLVKEEFNNQALYDGKVKLVFNRIFLIGIK
jgi:trans-aconitate methyltransferase